MTRVVPRRIANARVERVAVLDAKSQASAIVEIAREERDALHASAKEQALREGREELAAAWLQLEHERTTIRNDEQQKAKELAVEIARRIVGEVATRDESLVERALASALVRFATHANLVVAVAPADKDRAAHWLSENAPEAARVEARSNIEQGGCVIEGPQGRVDAQLQTQLAAFARALGVSS